MTVANHGAIALVFQDEENLAAKPDEPQVSQEVSGPDGTVSLADKVVVPANARELRLFIPLVPGGLSETSGEIALRYPITKSN